MTSPCWLGGGRVAQVVLYRGPPICGQKTILERLACIKDEMLCWYLNQWYIDQWLKLLFNLPSSLLPGNSKHVIRKVVAEFQSLSYCSVVEEVTRKSFVPMYTVTCRLWFPLVRHPNCQQGAVQGKLTLAPMEKPEKCVYNLHTFFL